jgi:imidazolonepropionase-like amidohydrolase
LLAQTRARAREIFALGTTTAEGKTGYGLEWESELKEMQMLLELEPAGAAWRFGRPSCRRTPSPPNMPDVQTNISL